MLERVAACLKSGAARDSLRCTRKAPRSKRMLHSTFWNHGAGGLDLPPWAVSMLPMPSDLPLKSGSGGTRGARRQEKPQQQAATEGVFLDFLYPPQALAWMQRATVQQQAQKREKRNIRRLPEGFVVASRGYASNSYQGDRTAADDHGGEDGGGTEADQLSMGSEASPVSRDFSDDWLGNSERSFDRIQRSQEQRGQESEDIFSWSPGELAEANPNNLNSLHNLLMLNRDAANLEDPEASRRLTKRAWDIFQSLDDETRNDSKLRRELLDWFAMHQNEIAPLHCEELYQAIPTGERTFEIYSAMLSLYLRKRNWKLVSDLHHEALQTLENGYMISKQLLEYAVQWNRWRLAIQTAAQHHNRYTELGQENQIQLFWLHVSEMPQLSEKAVLLYRYFKMKERYNSADSDIRLFCSRFFKETLTQFSLSAKENEDREWWRIFQKQLFRQDLISIFQYVAKTHDEAGIVLRDALYALLNRSNYSEYHDLVSGIYWEYRKLPDVQHSAHLLFSLLERLTWYEPGRKLDQGSGEGVTIKKIVDDWKWFYGKLPKNSYSRIVSSCAWAGRAEQHELWMRDFRSAYPEYDHWNDSLWTMIYLHARRTNLDDAQQAFAEVKRITAEHGEEPDLKCWSVLLHAHGRADDLEGAFTNFQNLVDSTSLKPNEACFAPIFAMLANRGDVDGIEDFMEQFDQIVGTTHTTNMVTHLINAYANQGKIQEAESVLRDAITKVRAGEIIGTMKPCFNAVMKAHAYRYDIDAAMDTYHWMKREGIHFDGDTFAAIMIALVNVRRTADAIKILNVDMREHRIEPTAFHFAVIMQRLVINTDFEAAIKLYKEMNARNIRPSVATNTLYLKAKAFLEHSEKAHDSNDNSMSGPLEDSIKDLEEMLERYDGEEVATPQRAFLVGLNDNTAADPAPYFETLVFLHGKRNSLEAVKSLFAKYKEAAKGRGGNESKLPLGLTSKLMSAYWHAGEYDQVEEYWKLAKERADEVAPPIQVPSFRYLVSVQSLQSADPMTLHPSSEPYPGPELDGSNGDDSRPTKGPKQTLLTDRTTMKIRPAASRRHILNQPLRWYLAALNSQSRIVDCITTVSSLLTQGYTLDKHSWNAFIRILLDTAPPLALVAFILTDRFLTPGFPGWVRSSETKYRVPRRARYEGLEYINTRYVAPSRLMPQYETIVRLGAALLDLRRLETQGRRGIRTNVPPELQRFVGTTREIRRLAAKTLHVVQSIPYIMGDKTQAKYLRREMN